MAFGAVTATTNGNAGALFSSTAAAAGITGVQNLSDIAQLQLVVANLLLADPTTVAIPAGDVLSGTFGANKAGGADSGDYAFPAAVIWTTAAKSTTALATPAALLATTNLNFASTVSGAVMMGFGTTHDVALKNQAGTTVFGILANAAAAELLGTLALTSTAAIQVSVNYDATHTASLAVSSAGALTINATSTVTITPATQITGALTLLAGALSSSASLGVGYATGAGGNVTQASNRSTAVTLNTVVGRITGNAASLAASTSASFTVVNTVVAANDLVLLSVVSGPTASTSVFSVSAVNAGNFVIRAANVATATGDVGAPVLAFAVIKGAVS